MHMHEAFVIIVVEILWTSVWFMHRSGIERCCTFFREARLVDMPILGSLLGWKNDTVDMKVRKLIGHIQQRSSADDTVMLNINRQEVLIQYPMLIYSGYIAFALWYSDAEQGVLLDKGLEHLCRLFDFAHNFDRTMKTCFALVLAPSLLSMGGVRLLGYGLIQAIWFKQISLILGASGAMEPLVRPALYQRRPALPGPELPALPDRTTADVTTNA